MPELQKPCSGYRHLTSGHSMIATARVITRPQSSRFDVMHWEIIIGNFWVTPDAPVSFMTSGPSSTLVRIIGFWLLFLEASPDPQGPHSLLHKECRSIVLANWNRILSKCIPGDKDLTCRLRDFTLDKTRKEDVKRAIAWLVVSLHCYLSYFYWLYLPAWRVADGLECTERWPRSLENLRL